MELKLALFDESPTNPSRNCVLFDNADRIRAALQKLDPKATEKRKFVVLKNEKAIYLVFGPKFVDGKDHPDFYMHRDLRQIGLHFLDRDGKEKYQISGGGLATFQRAMFGDPLWEAELGGYSSDYGVWDRCVLEHQQTVADWLGMRTCFSWRGHIYPTEFLKKRGL